MSLNNATVTIEYQDLQKLQDRANRLERELADAQKTLEEARLGSDDDDRRDLSSALKDATTIVTFAVGNLDPLSVRGWPYKELRRLAGKLESLPGVDPFLRESATDLKIFADEAAEWEKARAEGREQEKLASKNLGAVASPLTEE